MADLLIAPYLPLTNAARVGSWELVPFKDLDESEALPEVLRGPVMRLVEAYRLPSGGGAVLGSVVYPVGGEVGSPFERSTMSMLRRALLAGVVADNPTMALGDEAQSPNGGHAMATSENALLYGHPVGDGESYVIETGVLARVMALRSAQADEPLPKVEPPVELPRPIFGGFDAEVANATHGALAAGGVSARRLHRALDWYVVALSNAEAVSHDVRVGAVRSALEVLTDAGKSKKLVRAVGRLLRKDGAPAQTRASQFWKGPVQLTEAEWWLARFCELRNAIVHGDEVPDDLWIHEGHHHLAHAHDVLIRCLKAVVAGHADDPVLTMTRSERVFPRIAEAIAERSRDVGDGEGGTDL